MKQIATYSDAIEYLNQKQSLGIQPGLERIKETLDVLGNPQDSYKTIHIAGTNGKGTVAATIAHALTKAGHKVGLFTSPWVENIREQIQINGHWISESDFTNGCRALQIMQTPCTEFECLAVIAYTYFKLQHCDYAVIECGMGGAGDATNVEKNNLSVITKLSLDHTDFFGNTIEDIAMEKAGILRKNGECILYDDTCLDIFKARCRQWTVSKTADNLSLVNTVLEKIGVAPEENLVKLPARQERRGGILLDGGHNVSAAQVLAPLLDNETAIIGMLKDKDVQGYLSLVAPKCIRIIAVTPHSTRAMPAQQLASIAKKYCNDVIVCDNPADALRYKPGVICGSFYMIREVINLI